MRILPGFLAWMVLAAGCQSASQPLRAMPRPAGAESTLIGTSWVVEELDGRRLVERAPTLTLGDSQRLSGLGSCNRFFGTYEVGDGAIRLKPAGATRMACDPAVMEQEARFLAALEAVTAFRRDGNALLLADAGGRVRVRLNPAPPTGQSPAPAPLRARAFDCADGPTIVLGLADGAGSGQAIELALPDSRRRLLRTPTASGERYAHGGVSLWSHGREATLELDGRTYACTENRGRSILEDAKLRGVEFRALGQEPGWTLELFPDRMAFTGRYGTVPATTPRPAPSASLAAGETVYAAVTEAHRLTVRIRETRCLDSMSGQPFESTVEVELDGTVYRGCGEALR